MAKKELLGHVGPCVCCGFADMEVRRDKNENPYTYCPECYAQTLTHGRPERVKPLLARMRPAAAAAPVIAPVPPAELAPAPEKVPPVDPKPAPKKQRPAAKPEAAPAPAPVAKAGPFSTLLG